MVQHYVDNCRVYIRGLSNDYWLWIPDTVKVLTIINIVKDIENYIGQYTLNDTRHPETLFVNNDTLTEAMASDPPVNGVDVDLTFLEQ